MLAFRQIRIVGAMLLLLVLGGCRAGREPVIGISSCWNGGRVSLDDAYPAAVRAAGGVPLILPPVHSAEEASEALAGVDALILSGGEDVAPARYGEAVLNPTVEVNAPRDTSDFLLAAEALQREMPILGICRGSQLLNVLLGGSLYQDLPSQIEPLPRQGGIRHFQTESDSVATHWIYIDPDSRLHALIGRDSVMVNSFHHQAVKNPGTGVRVAARSADGVIEAWEWRPPQRKGMRQQRDGSILCVQFHPECLVDAGDPTFLPIFQDLIDRAR